jgi:hypothetical protein
MWRVLNGSRLRLFPGKEKKSPPCNVPDPFALAQLQEFNGYLCSTVHAAHAHGRRGARWADDGAAIEAMRRKVPATMAECFERHCQLNLAKQNVPEAEPRSPSGDRVPPLLRRLGSEPSERRARDEMALKVEGVVDGGVHAQKALGGASGLEALHFALASSHRLMRVFGPIVLAQPLLMRAAQSQTPKRGNVGPQLVGDQQFGREPLLLEQLAH